MYFMQKLDSVSPGQDVMLDFKLISRKDAPWMLDLHAIDSLYSRPVAAYEQFKLPVPVRKGGTPDFNLIDDTIQIQRVGENLNITIGTTLIVFDTVQGVIRSIEKDGQPVVVDGPRLNFWRPPTDNDRVDGHGELLWRRIGLDNLTWKVEDVQVYQNIQHPTALEGMLLLNGYTKNAETYRNNARIDSLIVFGSRFQVYTYEGKTDTNRNRQIMLFGEHEWIVKYVKANRLPQKYAGYAPEKFDWQSLVDSAMLLGLR